MSGEQPTHHEPYTPTPYTHHWLPPEEQLEASRCFLETMARRRTIRDFAATPVDFALIENAVRAAALAPSGANQQPSATPDRQEHPLLNDDYLVSYQIFPFVYRPQAFAGAVFASLTESRLCATRGWCGRRSKLSW